MCFCDYEPARIYRATIRRARKEHKCDECRRAIRPGESYEHVFGFWEYADTFKTCSHCLELRAFTKANVECVCWAHGNMIEDCVEAFREHAERMPIAFLRKLAAIEHARSLPPHQGGD